MDFVPKVKKPARRKKHKTVVSYKLVQPNEENEKFYVGGFLLGTSNNLMQETWTWCRSHINTLDSTDCLVVEFDDGNTGSINLLADAPLILNIISTKIFSLKFSQVSENVTLQLYFNKLPITQMSNKAAKIVKQVFDIIFHINDDCIKYSANECVENIPELFRGIRATQSIEIPDCLVQSHHLRPTLRPYQEAAVRWMIHRESLTTETKHLHPCYTPLTLPLGTEIFYDKFNGHVDLKKPLVTGLKTGGILADEMGLGKTVEILALILYNTSYNDVEDAKPMLFKKKRKRAPAVFKATEPDHPEPKKLKVPEDWTKKGKSATYTLLVNWYNDTLLSVNDVRSKPGEKYVQCVCGQYENRKNLVNCVDCNREQHRDCMGFKEEFGEYRCPQCWNLQPLLKSRATLIVCPVSLIDQWCKEISKHVKSGLSVLLYEGSCIAPVYPVELQEYDIVIMSYNVLQAELRQAEFTEHKSLRTQSKYANPGSSIILIEWHRLCFDEAQLVEGPTVSEMAQRLSAVHRWAITGTPISKGLSDLYVLIGFLQFEPYSDLATWNNTLYKPYLKNVTEPVTNFLSTVLWRTQKCDVLDQVNIPQQTVLEYYNDFTAVERYFYDKEHEMSRNEFLLKLKKLNMAKPLALLNKSELKSIMAPLLCLRQACVHHNAVKGRYLVTKKSVNSMEELLDALIAKNLSECEEYLRLIVSSINGAAGIHILLQNPIQAIVEYRKVLQMASKFQDDKSNDIKLTVDKLQLIHAMHNLAEIIASHPPHDKTLRDDTLLEDCHEIENKYMEKFIKQSVSVVESSSKFSNEIIALEEQLQLKPGQWYAAILKSASEDDLDEFWSRLRCTLENNSYEKISMTTSPKRLYLVLKAWEDELQQLREEAVDAVNELYEIHEGKVLIGDELVRAACDCHLRPTNKQKDKRNICLLCRANSSLKSYESKVYLMVRKTDSSNTGSWKPAIEEQILIALQSFARAKHMDDIIISDADITITTFELYKKEFKEVRKLWRYLDQQICACDEIDMCKIRMTLMADEGEHKQEKSKLKNLSYDIENPHANINQLKEHELVYHLSNVQSEEIENSKRLDKCIGTHKYLQTLHTQQNSGQSPDPCPICKNQLDTKWNILKCGHCFCIECMQMLLGQTIGKLVTCSICREKQQMDEINYIEISSVTKDNEGPKVRGNCSTKVENIVKLVMRLLSEDENVKILVFSNWVVILKVLHNIFEVNNISSEVLNGSSNQRKLESFKDLSKKKSVLLLPIMYGSKGLNLIEATHVVFAEPLLDPADELQAIGRVHRIGQTKLTFVHKFLMKDTIEESIYTATSTRAHDWDKNRVTLQQIKDLFFKDLVFQNCGAVAEVMGEMEVESTTV